MGDFRTVARVSDFDTLPGKIRRYMVDGKEIGLVLWEGEFFAFTNECTHRQYPLHFSKVQDGEVFCLSHGAFYQLPTGELKEGPAGSTLADAYDGLEMHDVQVVGGEIKVRLRNGAVDHTSA
jgi:nitrite reductase/ring-hydroxylating ferredoxin subunit